MLSYWTTDTSPLTIAGTQTGYPIAAQTVSGWTRYEYHITGQTTITLTGTSTIDELRLYPLGAQMTTYTYSPLVGMTSQIDAKNELTYYTYDNLNRLQATWDHNRNLLKSYCYNYQGTSVNCPVLTPPNTVPGSAVNGIFVHWVQGSYTETTYTDGGSQTFNTIYAPKTAYFYSDAACTQAITLTQGITLELDDTYNTYNATTNASTSTNQVHGTYTVPAGVLSYTVPSLTIHTDRDYYDDYGNYLDDTTDYYYYGVVVAGSTYQIIP